MQVQTASESAAALGVDAGEAKTALCAGALAGVVFAFQGGADGARLGAITGGDAGIETRLTVLLGYLVALGRLPLASRLVRAV